MHHEIPQPESISTTENYDDLFVDAPVVTEELRASWPELNDTQKAIFAPLEEKVAAPVELSTYDHLFDPNFDSSSLSVSQAAVKRETEHRSPSEQSLAEAVNRLRSPELDLMIREIIQARADKLDYAEEVDLIRVNPELREDLARYFLAKTQSYYSRMPERIARNTEKDPNYGGYSGKMRSKDYAVLLAISMLDGTFKNEVVGSDTVEHHPETGKVVLGQHRAAADLLLTLR